MFHVESVTKNLLFFVIQQNAENLVVDYAPDELRRATQQLLDVQDGAHFAADFVEQ